MAVNFENVITVAKSKLETLAGHLPDDKKYIIDLIVKDTEKYYKAKKDEFSEWKEYVFISRFYAETAKFAFEKADFREDTVFVVTYPKTGTTWVMEIVRQMLYGDDETLYNISNILTLDLRYLETGKPYTIEAMSSFPFPRILYGSHLPEELMNVEKITKQKGKFIIVLRNPKDQAVSFYHFLNQPGFKRMRDVIPSDWPGFFNKYIQGEISVSCFKPGEWYPEHILGWYKHIDKNNFLFLHFEDMKKDSMKEIRKIAKFLSLDLSEQRLHQITEKTAFKSMKKNGNQAFVSVSTLRQGQVGSWKDVFTVAQSELMDRIIEEKLGNTDIKFVYE